jgi:ATP-dependent protease ClpP protease subunit
MTPIDAIEYGLIDKIVWSHKQRALIGDVRKPAEWAR